MQNALIEATDEYMNKMLDSKNNNKRTSKGTISLIIDAAKERNGIPANSATPNKKAIYERGWYPLNYNVLLHPEIQLTQPQQNINAHTETATLPPDELNLQTGFAGTIVGRINEFC